MARYKSPIEEKHVPLVRRVLAASVDPSLSEFGKQGDVIYLIEENVTQVDVDIYDELITSIQSENRPPGAEDGMQQLRDAIQPYVGKMLLKTQMRLPGRQYEFYIDPVTETIVHFNVYQNDPSINMNLEWAYTIEDDAEYRHWLDSVLFPEDFFDETIFEASHTLYHLKLHESLVEDAIYRGIEPARFQKADLNAAIRDASSSLYGHSQAKWFHVEVQGNVVRFVEKYGSYSFDCPDCPLAPIYNFLLYHKADNGTTCAGLASAQQEWVLLFEDTLHISVHGERRFVEKVIESLEQV